MKFWITIAITSFVIGTGLIWYGVYAHQLAFCVAGGMGIVLTVMLSLNLHFAHVRSLADQEIHLSLRINPLRQEGRQMAEFMLCNGGKRPVNIMAWGYGGKEKVIDHRKVFAWGRACTANLPKALSLPVVLKEQELCDFTVAMNDLPLEDLAQFYVIDGNDNRYFATESDVNRFLRTAIATRDGLCPNDMEKLVVEADKMRCAKCGFYQWVSG